MLWERPWPFAPPSPGLRGPPAYSPLGGPPLSLRSRVGTGFGRGFPMSPLRPGMPILEVDATREPALPEMERGPNVADFGVGRAPPDEVDTVVSR